MTAKHGLCPLRRGLGGSMALVNSRRTNCAGSRWFPSGYFPGFPRLEFAAFSVKSRDMDFGGNGIIGRRRSGRLLPTVLLAAALALLGQTGARAQLFSDRPPPVPPAAVPDPGGAVSLAPPSGPAAAPTLPPTLTQPASPA